MMFASVFPGQPMTRAPTERKYRSWAVAASLAARVLLAIVLIGCCGSNFAAWF